MMLRDPFRPVIHWVSPLPPAETDIAHYTARILPYLAQYARVVLWTDANEWDGSLERFAPVMRLDADYVFPRDLQRMARLVGAPEGARHVMFTHIGNSWLFHANILRLARRMSSVVVLHDLAIQELMKDAVTQQLLDANTFMSEMLKWYGPAGQLAAERSLADADYARTLAPHMPGFELALPAALAVLVHTPAAADAVRARNIVPVHHLELPFQPSNTSPQKRPRLGPLRLLQFGYIGPNRRLLEIIRALGPLKSEVAFHFDVMGKIWDTGRIKREVEALGLQRHVRLHGFVSEAQLDASLRQAHLVFNLRYPTLGEASGSQLRIWNAGAAAVVRKSGWYATLPSDTVFHISDNNETEATELQTLIRCIASDRTSTDQVRDTGYRMLLSHHHPEDYARKIAEIAKTIGPAASCHLYAPRMMPEDT